MWLICQNFGLEPNFHLPFWKFGKKHHGPPQPAKQVFACLAHKMSCVDGFWPDLAESRVLDPNIFLTNFQPSMNKTVRTASVFPFLDAIFWHFQPFFWNCGVLQWPRTFQIWFLHKIFFWGQTLTFMHPYHPHWPPAVPPIPSKPHLDAIKKSNNDPIHRGHDRHTRTHG